MQSGWRVLVAFVVACNSPRAPVDPPLEDAMADGPSADAPGIDAAVDALAIDALAIDGPPSTSPRCSTIPTLFWDVSPKRLGNMKRAGDTLYVSAYELTNGGTTVANPEVITLDLTTGTQVGTALPTARPVELWATGAVVYGSDYAADGTVWKFQSGAAPVIALEHIAVPGPVIEEGGYLYWTENAYNSTVGAIKRKLLPAGGVENVMPCTNPRELFIDAATIYCVSSSGITRGLKAGGSIPESMVIPDGYPIVSAIQDGDSLYFVSLHPTPTLYRLPLFGTTATTLHQETQIGRYRGLAVTSDFFYLSDDNRGIRRIDRATLAPQIIVASPGVEADPLIWNDDLFFQDDNPQIAGSSYVMRCAD